MDETIHLDGALGEGGGQVLRTSLSLAALLRRPLQLTRIRAGRARPGLAAQHLTGVLAVAAVSRGQVEGAALGSQELFFNPQPPRGGEYEFDVADVHPSAGATGLVAQVLLPLLWFCREPSRVLLRGGTHVPWSPSFHYLAEVFLPTLARMGAVAQASLKQAGWYPQGGGEMVLEVTPLSGPLQPLRLTEAGPVRITGLSAASNLPRHILRRQAESAQKRCRQAGYQASLEQVLLPGRGAGTVCFLRTETGAVAGGFTALGAPGKPAEQVGREAAEALLTHLQRGGAVEEHLADQLILYLALAAGRSTFTTSCLSRHLLTNVQVVERFLPVRFAITGSEGEPGEVSVEGIGYVPETDS
jgi:RNA 3'-terminal phosphate cyclase (ATP)